MFPVWKIPFSYRLVFGLFMAEQAPFLGAEKIRESGEQRGQNGCREISIRRAGRKAQSHSLRIPNQFNAGEYGMKRLKGGVIPIGVADKIYDIDDKAWNRSQETEIESRESVQLHTTAVGGEFIVGAPIPHLRANKVIIEDKDEYADQYAEKIFCAFRLYQQKGGGRKNAEDGKGEMCCQELCDLAAVGFPKFFEFHYIISSISTGMRTAGFGCNVYVVKNYNPS